MNKKIIYVRTELGEDEARSKTAHLGGDVKRALLMVDGEATFGEMSKRAAPSLRNNLEALVEELIKDGYIQEKIKSASIPKPSVSSTMIPAIKIAKPKKIQPAEEDGGELDFMSGFSPSPDEDEPAENITSVSEETELDIKERAEKAKAEAEAARLREEAERKAKAEAEAARLREETERKAKAEAETAHLREEAERKAKAEAEAARLREETERKAKAEAETAHLREEAERKAKAEAEAARLREEAERKAKAEAEAARLREEAERKAKAEAERKAKLEAEAAQMRAELEAAKLKAELEAKARREAEIKAHARMKAEEEATERRAKEQQAAKEREIAEKKAAEKLAAEQASKNAGQAAQPSGFSFDSFQISETDSNAKLDNPDSKAQQVAPNLTSSKPESGQFAFDSFQVNESIQSPEETTEESNEGNEPSPPPDFGKHANADSEGHTAIEKTSEHIAPEPQASELPAKKQAPDPEQIKRVEQERLAAEERKAKAEQEKKLAEEQAKIWAEAEQRAIETAKVKAEKAQHQSEHHAPEKQPSPASPKKQSNPFPWGKLVGFFFKLGIFLLVLLAAALYIAPNVMPMRDYMPKIEQYMSGILKQPVHVGRLSGQFLPFPRLDIGEVYIGDEKQLQIDLAELHFSAFDLFNDKKPIGQLTIHKVTVSGKGLESVAAWMQKLASNDLYPVSRIDIKQCALDTGAFEMSDIEGDMTFDLSNKLTQVNLRANAGKYTLSITPSSASTAKVSLTLHDSALPLLPNWVFDDLNANGEFNANEISFNEFDAHIRGGFLKGSANLNWRTGWRAQGTFKVENVSMNKLNDLLDGSANGSARFKMAASELGELTDSATLNGDFSSVDKGTINGMDIVETARIRSKDHLPGGRTHYKQLSGAVSFEGNAYHFKQLKVSAEGLNASGELEIKNRELSGTLNTKVTIQEELPPVDLQISGVVDSPQLSYVRK